jgi:hypothetical protein
MIKINKKEILIVFVVSCLPKAYTAMNAVDLVERDVSSSIFKLKRYLFL